MIAKIWTERVLRKEAGEEIEGGGGAAVETPPAEGGEGGGEGAGEGEGAGAGEGAGEGAAETEAKVGFLASIRAGLQGKGALLSRAEQAEAEVGTLRAENARLLGEVSSLREQVQTLQGERQQIEQLLDEEKGRKDTAAQAAAELLEQQGFKVVDLPAAESHADTIEGMQERLASEKDPKKKFEIAAAINAKRWEQN